MAAFDDKLAALQASIPSRVRDTQSIVSNIGAWLDRYRGGMPLGFLAAIAQFESGGKMTAGDPNLGEYGIFQVAASTPPTFGYPAAARTDPETNVFLGALEYNVEAVKMALADPRVTLGTDDSWKLARLAFAIGSGGTKTLLANAQGYGGSAWSAVRSYVDATGGIPLGSQTPDTVRLRVHAVDTVWDVGQQASGGGSSLPSIPPPPPSLNPPTIPPSILDRIASARSAQLLLVAALGVGAWFYFRR